VVPQEGDGGEADVCMEDDSIAGWCDSPLQEGVSSNGRPMTSTMPNRGYHLQIDVTLDCQAVTQTPAR
jgi:hypothetical protein